jgi:hypothetical protein
LSGGTQYLIIEATENNKGLPLAGPGSPWTNPADSDSASFSSFFGALNQTSYTAPVFTSTYLSAVADISALAFY